MAEVIDIAFALTGRTIPADHGWPLYRLLAGRLDWLEEEGAAGVHPIRSSGSSFGSLDLQLGRRGRLMLRLPEHRAAEARRLTGSRLDLGEGIEVGAARLRRLFAHGTLYSPFVSTGSGAEAVFLDEVEQELRRAQVECKVICGRARSARCGDAEVTGFGLMLHGLSPEHSLAVQESGLGAGRKFGCGIFVPHRSAAAVGI